MEEIVVIFPVYSCLTRLILHLIFPSGSNAAGSSIYNLCRTVEFIRLLCIILWTRTESWRESETWPQTEQLCFCCFFTKKWRTSVYFVWQPIPLFWTSGDVYPGFQSHSGFLACVPLRLCAMYSSNSPLVLHLLTSWRTAMLSSSTIQSKPMLVTDFDLSEKI